MQRVLPGDPPTALRKPRGIRPIFWPPEGRKKTWADMSASVVPLHEKAVAGSLWSINALAQEFGTGWNQVDKALRGVPPDGEIRGKKAWKVSTAAPFLVTPPSTSDEEGEKSLDDMDPRDRLDWVKSERELMKMRVEAGELVPVDQHIAEVSRLAKLAARTIETLPDLLERSAGLTAVQVEKVTQVCDAAREDLYQSTSSSDDAGE